MIELRAINWIVRCDGIERARFRTEYDAGVYADQIREAEAVKGFYMYVDVRPAEMVE